MAQGVRLQDVADLAGVSIGTASQALNHRPGVAIDTRARVIDAARALGYPTKLPSRQEDAQVEVVGMLTKHDFGYPPTINPFYSVVQAGAEEECRKQGISLLYANVEVDASNHPVVWPAMLSESRIDGLLLVGTFIENTVETLKRRLHLPIVLVDAYAPRLPYDSVLIDNVMGTTSVIEHLMDLGHQCIGLIGTHAGSPPSLLARRDSFRHLLRDRGLSDSYIEDSELTQDSGRVALRRLLVRAPEVTAVFAAADIVAIGALHAARDLGIDVPGELSLIGFDNIDVAGVVMPPLTTVHVHKTWMGMLGIRQLLYRAAEPLQPKVSIAVATELVVRASTAAVRGRG